MWAAIWEIRGEGYHTLVFYWQESIIGTNPGIICVFLLTVSTAVYLQDSYFRSGGASCHVPLHHLCCYCTFIVRAFSYVQVNLHQRACNTKGQNFGMLCSCFVSLPSDMPILYLHHQQSHSFVHSSTCQFPPPPPPSFFPLFSTFRHP